ncbi:hypothetical protein EDC96DRAFT_546886 [Choanephora cucurbitarum]|nr:hypothetical protein EDC96DRAFT_549904 [Choanephora cucurbitarum]KAI8350913.1 hypothetical protein EDC96DRAFT_546886 [Choanephora cucurbitarum]
MTPTQKYVIDLLTSLNLVVDRLAALEKQSTMLAKRVRVLGEQVQQQSNQGTTTTMARSFRYNMPKRTNPTASLRWVLADAFPDRTEEESKALYKNFNNISLKACTSSRDVLSFECESCWPVGFAIQNSWTEFSKRQRKRAVRLAARNASVAS